MAHLRALVVDDERPALEELGYLLRLNDQVSEVTLAQTGAEALRLLDRGEYDAVFLDIEMPGLTGLDVARVLGRFTVAPAVVFVTAHEAHAVEAFEINAVDYLLKPVREERVREAVRRVVASTDHGADDADDGDDAGADEVIAVELGGVTRVVRRSEVRYVEAQGDYVRLHTPSGSHLVRVPLTELETRWAPAGFARIHRSLLVALAHVTELRVAGGRSLVVVGGEELPVSRRHTAEFREVFTRGGRAEPEEP